MANNSAGKNVKKIGRIYYTQVATTPEGEPVMMGTFLVANQLAVILFDSGASHTFISKKFVEKYCILSMNWLGQHKAILNIDFRTIRLSYGHEEVLLSIPCLLYTSPSPRDS